MSGVCDSASASVALMSPCFVSWSLSIFSSTVPVVTSL